ncbi:MAG: hypothetical protein PV362_04355, partial [Providencia heimbachae]|nr:hypothetical protein [Providencia heimbachae]
TPLPPCGPEGQFEYLGLKFAPWTGFDHQKVICDFINTIPSIKRLKLKPTQKLELLRKFIIPHFLYKLSVNPPPQEGLRNVDKHIRSFIKDTFHLPACTSSSFIYAPNKDGGLGVPRVENLIKYTYLRSALKCRDSDDPVLRKLWTENGIEERVNTLARKANISEFPLTIEIIERAKRRAKRTEWRKWLSCSSQGQGASSFKNDKVGNSWMKRLDLLRNSRFIDALRLRTNTFGCKAALARAGLTTDMLCRRCHAANETLGHILGQCPAGKGRRIRRHDEIAKLFIKGFCEKFPDSQYTIEPTLETESKRLRPDIIISTGDAAYIVDVTVRYEQGETLKRAYSEKYNKYKCLKELVQNIFGVPSCEVLPLVVGSRGAMPRSTLNTFEELTKNGKKDALTASMIALRSSIEITNAFLDEC